MVNVAVLGVTGRMGRCLVRAIREAPDLTLSGALASPDSAALGRDAGDVAECGPVGVEVTSDRLVALERADVAIDFTLPDVTLDNLAVAGAQGIPMVVGTTGLTNAHHEALRVASRGVAVLFAPNMSLGMNLLFSLVAQAAAALPADYDIEIIEAHHRHKVDAPSGTALRIGEIAAGARKTTLQGSGVYSRMGNTGPRPDGSIGFATVRGGDIVGDHTVLFAATGERLEISHRASDRMTFAYGALQAARWLAGRPPGMYGMADVLDL
ncbi:MAG: 4-hydroxy-tetrahydrodipicolinate reductase [Gammaproteobacteria bacterium]|nr:4-hydroxy-tetrahydrodipicolinate reductase [Gammaproteobacteria bacterium]